MARYNFTKLSPTTATPGKVNCREAEWVEIHINDLSGGDTITVSRALQDDASYLTWRLLDSDSNSAGSSFTAAGIYQTEGGAWLKFTKTGSASTPTVHICSQVAG
jgi:hypothetical protein